MAHLSSLTESSFHLGLAEDLPIIKESTTSRVVVTNDLIRVVQFTFDAGELLTAHSSPRAGVVQLLEGEMSFTIGEDERTLHTADTVYLAPGQEHALTAITPCRLSLVMVDVAADKEQ